MESLELKIDADKMDQGAKITALKDTSIMARDAEKRGFQIEKLNLIYGVPRLIIIKAIDERKTKEDILAYVKEKLPRYNFT